MIFYIFEYWNLCKVLIIRKFPDGLDVGRSYSTSGY